MPAGIAYDWALFDEALDSHASSGACGPSSSSWAIPPASSTTSRTWTSCAPGATSSPSSPRAASRRYGRDEVREWWFETWNEPDLPFWRWGERGFLNYVDACRAGLDAVDPSFVSAGPGTALHPLARPSVPSSPIATSGTNALTGEQACGSTSSPSTRKASREHEADLTPRTLGDDRARAAGGRLHPRAPSALAGLPFINNECDPEVGWLVPHTYRALPYYAALMAKMIDQHRRLMIEGAGVDCRAHE